MDRYVDLRHAWAGMLTCVCSAPAGPEQECHAPSNFSQRTVIFSAQTFNTPCSYSPAYR